ncbi:Citronellyl-CoA dehydrogenase (plasmid) [Paraburkholderia caribensis MBA4]|uniref:Citronellyl-CoA dehydrogenase n=1 Tax=Paraburkholderia caribensis MBA4 TaxID=1323664 RepID=A0A0P0RQ48_9BURK|nr:acyl-CoA dehydrogenase family protein [Paraburkholderia caribensis]ALL71131.1 Citronellyl-CoA dehydrogenase [Paraburkholderia caribensis MBA4]
MFYSEQHHQLMDAMKRFIDSEIDPFSDEWEEAGVLPARQLFKKLGRAGYLGVNRPVEFGGQGLDFSYNVASAEALGHVRAQGVSMGIMVQTDMATPALARHGSAELKREFLAPAIAGDVVVSLGVSEAGAGSDVSSIKTRARKAGGDYVISGSKMWITNATQADWICLLANTADCSPHKNKSLIVVPLRAHGKLRPGIELSSIRKLGNWSSDTAQIFFDEVRVPQHYRIGEENMGFIYQMEQFQEERMAAAARRLGCSHLITGVADYLRQRIAFGKPLLDNQYIQYKLAELKTEVEALRGLVYTTAEKYISGQDVTELASMAKLKAGRLSREVADWCIQFYGGMGYTWDNPASRAWRDSRLGSIGGGADEVMLAIISKKMGLSSR